MKPDPGSPADPYPYPAPDPESLLRSLRFRPLPDAWRDEILAAALPVTTAAAAAAPPPPAAAATITTSATTATTTPETKKTAAQAAPDSQARRIPSPRSLRAWFRRPLARGLAAAWTLIAALRLTTPSSPAPTPAQMLAFSRLQAAPFQSLPSPADFQFASAGSPVSARTLNLILPN